MTVKFGFYDSLNGDRLYNADDINTFFEGVFTDGVFELVGDKFEVVNDPGQMGVLVKTGRAWFNNLWIRNTSVLPLVIQPSSLIYDRIDLVVLEFNSDITVRENSIKVLTGTPAAIPVPPNLSNTTTLKQYALAQITVGAGASEITMLDITNKVGTSGTPYATSILTVEIDTESLITGWTKYDTVIPTRISSDDPTYTIRFSGVNLTSILEVGQPVKLSQNGSLRYGWISSLNFSSPNTDVTILTRLDSSSSLYDILDTSTYPITLFGYGRKGTIPFGMPGLRTNWDLVVVNTTTYLKTNPTVNTWYNAVNSGNLPSITLPIGDWKNFKFSASCRIEIPSSPSYARLDVCLSTNASLGSGTPADLELAVAYNIQEGYHPTSLTAIFVAPFNVIGKSITITTPTTYYMYFKGQGAATITSLQVQGANVATILKAECAYL